MTRLLSSGPGRGEIGRMSEIRPGEPDASIRGVRTLVRSWPTTPRNSCAYVLVRHVSNEGETYEEEPWERKESTSSQPRDAPYARCFGAHRSGRWSVRSHQADPSDRLSCLPELTVARRRSVAERRRIASVARVLVRRERNGTGTRGHGSLGAIHDSF